MPVLEPQQRLSKEAPLRDRRWSSLVWQTLVPPAKSGPQVSQPSPGSMQRLLQQLCFSPILMQGQGSCAGAWQCRCPQGARFGSRVRACGCWCERGHQAAAGSGGRGGCGQGMAARECQ